MLLKVSLQQPSLSCLVCFFPYASKAWPFCDEDILSDVELGVPARCYLVHRPVPYRKPSKVEMYYLPRIRGPGRPWHTCSQLCALPSCFMLLLRMTFSVPCVPQDPPSKEKGGL
jgi:hypothetical protein